MTRKDYKLVAVLIETRPMPMIQTPAAYDEWEEIVRAIGDALGLDDRFYKAVGVKK